MGMIKWYIYDNKEKHEKIEKKFNIKCGELKREHFENEEEFKEYSAFHARERWIEENGMKVPEGRTLLVHVMEDPNGTKTGI
jgi:hypothetical protein